MAAFHNIATGIIVASTLLLIIRTLWVRKRSARPPPGPPGEWILGNARQLPTESSWIYYAQLKEKYGEIILKGVYLVLQLTHTTGDVIHLSALGQPLLILGSYQAAYDLLNRRAAIYSDRPRSVLVGEMFVPVPLLELERTDHFVQVWMGKITHTYALFTRVENTQGPVCPTHE